MCCNARRQVQAEAQVASLEGELAAAQEKLLEKAELHFIGPSVPKRKLDEVKAEDAKEIVELWERIKAAEGELVEAKTRYDRLLHTHDDVTLPLLYEAEGEKAALTAALERYGQHEDGCQGTAWGCTCGLAAMKGEK